MWSWWIAHSQHELTVAGHGSSQMNNINKIMATAPFHIKPAWSRFICRAIKKQSRSIEWCTPTRSWRIVRKHVVSPGIAPCWCGYVPQIHDHEYAHHLTHASTTDSACVEEMSEAQSWKQCYSSCGSCKKTICMSFHQALRHVDADTEHRSINMHIVLPMLAQPIQLVWKK